MKFSNKAKIFLLLSLFFCNPSYAEDEDNIIGFDEFTQPDNGDDDLNQEIENVAPPIVPPPVVAPTPRAPAPHPPKVSGPKVITIPPTKENPTSNLTSPAATYVPPVDVGEEEEVKEAVPVLQPKIVTLPSNADKELIVPPPLAKQRENTPTSSEVVREETQKAIAPQVKSNKKILIKEYDEEDDNEEAPSAKEKPKTKPVKSEEKPIKELKPEIIMAEDEEKTVVQKENAEKLNEIFQSQGADQTVELKKNLEEGEDYDNTIISFEEFLTSSEDEDSEFENLNKDKIADNFTQNNTEIKKFIGIKEYEGAEIIVLNKITAKTTLLNLKKGESDYCGNIEIKLYKSIKNTDPYNLDDIVLLSVTEKKLDDDPKVIFKGWLFSSSNSLSSVQHPVYEIFAKKTFK